MRIRVKITVQKEALLGLGLQGLRASGFRAFWLHGVRAFRLQGLRALEETL